MGCQKRTAHNMETMTKGVHIGRYAQDRPTNIIF